MDVAEDGWTVEVVALEIGAKGWIPPSFFKAFKRLGFSSARTRKLADNCQLLARKCSYLIWVNRYNRDFQPWRVTASKAVNERFVAGDRLRLLKRRKG